MKRKLNIEVHMQLYKYTFHHWKVLETYENVQSTHEDDLWNCAQTQFFLSVNTTGWGSENLKPKTLALNDPGIPDGLKNVSNLIFRARNIKNTPAPTCQHPPQGEVTRWDHELVFLHHQCFWGFCLEVRLLFSVRKFIWSHWEPVTGKLVTLVLWCSKNLDFSGGTLNVFTKLS